LRASDGTLVDLTGAEFELLTTFVEQPQRVVARHRLLELSRMRLGDSSTAASTFWSRACGASSIVATDA
jgi:DNA-binding response OmpR family regulator